MTLAKDYLVDTILIDGDLRNAAVSARLGRYDDKGLMNVLRGECDLNAALVQHAHRNLRILCTGQSNGDRLSLPARRGEMQKLLDSLRHRDVLVIVDGPPILPMADMNLYAEIVDGILMVVRGGKTPQRVVIEALDFLQGKQIEGVVLNDSVIMQRAYSTYGYSRYAIAEPPLLLHQPGKHDSSSSSHKGAA
jgi:Mrp family chromosome partitioning ATPase